MKYEATKRALGVVTLGSSAAVLALALGACSSGNVATAQSSTQGASGAEHAHGGPGHHGPGHGEGHHPPMSPAVHAYHEVLRPVWHSEPGPGRDARACEQVGEFRTRAAAIVAAPAPEGASAGYAEAARGLVASVEALGAACGANRAEVNAAFTANHTAFHRVMDAGAGR